MKFITASREYNTFEKNVPAPYIRKSFVSENSAKGKIKIAVCGFYELYFNGVNITKGFLAPYISNTDHYVYCDEYEVTVEKGENVIGVILGNGFQNNPGGWVWEFDKARFRSAPKFALCLEFEDKKIESGTDFKVHSSPIIYDDYRYGTKYNANHEIDGWNKQGFDDTKWKNALLADTPKGEIKLCEAESITADFEIEPIAIFPEEDGFVYDFGICHSGVCRLEIDAQKGQEIVLTHGEILKDGKFNIDNLCCDKNRTEHDLRFIHKDIYICKQGKQTYMPIFTYHGFRYVKVTGINSNQATKDLLKFVVLHSDLETRGDFHCSDDTVNKLQQMTRRSDISNFHYFPTDCPQREKNGWTADVALSCEHILLNFGAENSFCEWMRNLCKAQNENGAIPCVVPTGDWGYGWGSGPAWDCALVLVPYFTYIYRGDAGIITESADTIHKYLKFLITKKDEKGLVHFGLGDWCHAGRPEDKPKAPLEVTDTIISMVIAERSAFLFGIIGETDRHDFALSVAEDLKKAFRENLIDFSSMTVKGDCQTSQALALYYGAFAPEEEKKAFGKLLEFIREADDHIDCGVLGARVIFHLLSRFGYSDLAYKMITRKDFPSYRYWIEQGATTLWENFDKEKIKSCNHHFWGDISAWFIKCIAGINYNPYGDDIKYLEIKPNFLQALDNAEGYYITPFGKVESEWKREKDKIVLKLEIPEVITAKIILPKGYQIKTESENSVVSGEYIIVAD